MKVNKMRINENQKVTLTFGQLRRLVKESKVMKKRLVTEGNIGEDYDFNAAYEFLMKNKFDRSFFEAFDKIQAAIDETAELKSAIDMACKDNAATKANVIRYFKAAFPSALGYEYSINDDEYSIEGNYALSYLLMFPKLFA